MRMSVKIVGIAIVTLAVINVLVWYAAISARPGVLTVSFLDIGQGDAIFIRAPNGRTALIDGGPGSSVVRQLGREMRWFDRSIDLVIATHPDADHVGGLIDVLKKYNVSIIAQSSVDGSSSFWDSFERAAIQERQQGAHIVTAQRGQVFDLGDGAYLEVLSPDRAVPHVETNMGCVVTRLVYGDTAFMLPCDAPQAIEKYLTYLDGKNLKSDVLKAGHHGSKTSSSALFLGFVNPTYGVFSRGCKNRYGHPAPETVDIFKRFNIPVEDTCTKGTITFISDGQKVSLQ